MQVPLPAEATQQSLQAFLAAVDAAIAAAIEALEGDWTRMVALMDALRKRAAAVRARVQAHSVKLSEVEDSVLTDITERSLQVDLGTNKTIFQQLLSALTSARRAVQACMAGCGLNLRVAESDARPKMGSCQHAAADVVSFAASACYLEKASCQDLRVRDIILDRLDVRVQAAVHPRLFLPVPPYLLASPCTPQCTQRSKALAVSVLSGCQGSNWSCGRLADPVSAVAIPCRTLQHVRRQPWEPTQPPRSCRERRLSRGRVRSRTRRHGRRPSATRERLQRRRRVRCQQHFPSP